MCSCTVDPAYTFPLYDGTDANGAAKLVRCIPQPTGANATNCDAALYGTFNVEVFSNPTGTGNVAGCMRSNFNTPCPAGAPFAYLAQIDPANPAAPNAAPSFAITQCRSGVITDCNAPAIGTVAYRVPMRLANSALVSQ